MKELYPLENGNGDEIDITFLKLVQEHHRDIEEDSEEYCLTLQRQRDYGENRIISSRQLNLRQKHLESKFVVRAVAICTMIASVGAMQYEGARYVTRNVIESGALPDNLSVRSDSQAGLLLAYQDEYLNWHNIENTDEYMYEKLNIASDYGFTMADMAVAMEYAYGYHVRDVSMLDKFRVKFVGYAKSIENQDCQKGVSK